jgi:hypothetical protein
MQCQSNPLILNSRRGLHAAPEGAVQNAPQIKMVWRQVDKKGSAGLNYVLLANDVPKCGWECLSLAYFVQGIHHLACPQHGSTTLSVRTTFPTVHGSCMEEHRWELTPPHNEDNSGFIQRTIGGKGAVPTSSRMASFPPLATPVVAKSSSPPSNKIGSDFTWFLRSLRAKSITRICCSERVPATRSRACSSLFKSASKFCAGAQRNMNIDTRT